MSQTIGIRLQGKDHDELLRRAEVTGDRVGTIARELVEKALEEHRHMEELRHRLESVESRLESLQDDLRSFCSAILVGVGSLGTEEKLTPAQVKAWLRSKGVGS